MLYILTGDIQTGKTRWLLGLVEELRGHGVTPYGALAPGMWEFAGRTSGEAVYEKLGIEGLLLPQDERIAFAWRRDLAVKEGLFDRGSQSAQAKLGWEIDDKALAHLNKHFDALSDAACHKGATDAGLLVVDELGQLELLHDKGLTSAVALLEAGPGPMYGHALVVVRKWLYDKAEERFSKAWGGTKKISPDDAARMEVMNALAE